MKEYDLGDGQYKVTIERTAPDGTVLTYTFFHIDVGESHLDHANFVITGKNDRTHEELYESYIDELLDRPRICFPTQQWITLNLSGEIISNEQSVYANIKMTKPEDKND